MPQYTHDTDTKRIFKKIETSHIYWLLFQCIEKSELNFACARNINRIEPWVISFTQFMCKILLFHLIVTIFIEKRYFSSDCFLFLLENQKIKYSKLWFNHHMGCTNYHWVISSVSCATYQRCFRGIDMNRNNDNVFCICRYLKSFNMLECCYILIEIKEFVLK